MVSSPPVLGSCLPTVDSIIGSVISIWLCWIIDVGNVFMPMSQSDLAVCEIWVIYSFDYGSQDENSSLMLFELIGLLEMWLSYIRNCIFKYIFVTSMKKIYKEVATMCNSEEVIDVQHGFNRSDFDPMKHTPYLSQVWAMSYGVSVVHLLEKKWPCGNEPICTFLLSYYHLKSGSCW